MKAGTRSLRCEAITLPRAGEQVAMSLATGNGWSRSEVAAEVDLLGHRLTGSEEAKATVLPDLLRGTELTSLPPLLHRRVSADFREGAPHFAALLDLVLTLYRIQPAEVSDHRAALRDNLATAPA